MSIFRWVLLVLVGTSSIWAASDAHSLRQRGFKIMPPGLVFSLCCAFWIFIFPWYLVKRERVLRTAVKSTVRTAAKPTKYVDSVQQIEVESISERLKDLEALYWDGLVSQQEYDDKRKQIVNSL